MSCVYTDPDTIVDDAGAGCIVGGALVVRRCSGVPGMRHVHGDDPLIELLISQVLQFQGSLTQ